MRKFALYYGVLRSNGELKTISLGGRGEIQNFKAQCKKDMADEKTAIKYSSLVLATDYGLKNHYKLTLPDAPRAKTKKEDK
tara:strand:- start:2382 stop:2624 length:243 start_codon:yes stop_codon:yes gene_type:complete